MTKGDGVVDIERKAGHNVPHPHSLSEAYSEIQKLSLTDSESVKKEIVTFSDFTSFSRVGMKSAIEDITIWVLGSLLSAIIVYCSQRYFAESATDIFFFRVGGSPIYWMLKMASLGGIGYSTIMCFRMGRYYSGQATRRAIMGVWTARFPFLIYVAFCYFLLLGLLYKELLSDEAINQWVRAAGWMQQEYRESVFSFLHDCLKPELFKAGVWAVMLSILSVVVCLLSGVIFRFTNRRSRELDGSSL